MRFKKVGIAIILTLISYGLSMLLSSTNEAKSTFHSKDELLKLKQLIASPLQPGEYFLTSYHCRGCHGPDLAQNSNINEAGEDINLVDRWESSMMALSAKDPFWRAKVRQEILLNPNHAGEIQNKCLDCHAPMGAYTSKFHGNQFYGLADMDSDSLGLDGVSCASCHTIKNNGLGSMFSGNIPFDTTHVIYGPFVNPSVAQMQLYEGYTPTHSPHMNQSKVCSSCHTLITQTFDLNGNLTGGEFFEQSTYHEYLNSSFPANNIKCQTCHMPKLSDAIIIANGFQGLTPRTPFNQHSFAGANFFMLNLIKNNKESLDVAVPDVRFDSTIINTLFQLQHNSIELDATIDSTNSDTAFFKVKIKNKTGHKFPSAYPSRRAILQFIVTDANNDTVFSSGTFNSQYRVVGENQLFEPHHNIIRNSGTPQIYEMIPGDVNGNFTSVLERASILLKDNRLPPLGFSTLHQSYDTTKISNDALQDNDFNKLNGIEGSGSDFIYFNVPIAQAVTSLKVKAKMYYQSVPPKWIDELFTLNHSDINKFKNMYQNADQNPVLMVTDSIENIQLPVNIKQVAIGKLSVYPTILEGNELFISANNHENINTIQIFNSLGKIVYTTENNSLRYLKRLEFEYPTGVYFIKISTNKKRYYFKIVKL